MNLQKILTFKNFIKFGLFLFILLQVAFFSGYFMYAWHFGKLFVFQVILSIFALVSVFYLIFGKEKRVRIRLNKIDLFFALFFLSMLVSVFFGINFERSFFGDQARASGVFSYLNFFLFYLLLRIFFQKRDYNLSFLIIVFSALISSLAGFLAYLLPSFADLIAQKGRMSGLIGGNSIFFAYYLTFPLFLAFGYYFKVKDRAVKRIKNIKFGWLFAFYIALLLLALVLANSRGAFLAVLLGFLFFLFFAGNKKQKIVFAVFSLIFVFIAYLNSQNQFLYSYLGNYARLFDLNPFRSSSETRLLAWKIAFDGFLEHPVFGYGPENYQQIFDKYYNPKFLDFSFAETIWDKPHNFFLEILGGQGVVGFLTYILLIFYLFQTLFRLYKNEENESQKRFYLALASGLFAYLFQLFFLMETANTFLVFTVFVAYLAYKRDGKEYEIFGIFKYLFLAFVFLFAVFSLYFSFFGLKSSYFMREARDFAQIGSLYNWQKSADRALKKDNLFLWENAVFLTRDLSFFDNNNLLNRRALLDVAPKIEQVFLERLSKNENNYLYNFWLASLYSIMGQYLDAKYLDLAEKHFKKALSINDKRQAVYLNLSKVYILKGDNQKAIDTIKKILEVDKDRPVVHWFLGLAYLQNNEFEKGIEELKKGYQFAKTSKQNLLYLTNLYIKSKRYKDAIQVYSDLILIDKLNAALYYHDRALMRFQIGDYKGSLQDFQIATKLNPDLKKRVENFIKINKEKYQKYEGEL